MLILYLAEPFFANLFIDKNSNNNNNKKKLNSNFFKLQKKKMIRFNQFITVEEEYLKEDAIASQR